MFCVNFYHYYLPIFSTKYPLFLEALRNKYSKAESNVAELKRLGATVLHGVDAKEMKLHPELKNRRFDRIVFNLPHAGFTGKEDDEHMIKYVHNLIMYFLAVNV